MAALINKSKDVGNVSGLQLGIEALLKLLVLVGLGAVPDERFLVSIKIQMFELFRTQLLIERAPLRVEFNEEGIQCFVNRLAQSWNVERLERFGLVLHGHQVI